VAYTYTGPTGPTANYAGDPNDYQGGSGFNANSFVDSLFSNLGDTLNGVAAIISTTHGNPVTQPGMVTYQPQQQQQQQQQQQSNTVLYIVLAIVVLVLVLGGAYLFLRK